MNNEDEKHDMDIEDDDGVDGAVVTESDEDEVLDMVRWGEECRGCVLQLLVVFFKPYATQSQILIRKLFLDY